MLRCNEQLRNMAAKQVELAILFSFETRPPSVFTYIYMLICRVHRITLPPRAIHFLVVLTDRKVIQENARS